MARTNRDGTLPLFDRAPAFFATDPPKLRAYQSRAIQALRDRVRSGKRRPLLVAPTGGGKMVLLASIIRTSSVPVLFVCHLRELIDQCVEQLRLVGISNVGVIRGDDDRANPTASIQVASIQTLARRDKPPAGLVLIDEAHRAISQSYQDLLEFYIDSIVIGFTATPIRVDSRPMGNVFDSLDVVVTYEKLIQDGHIVAPLTYGGPVEIDLSKIKITGSDYDDQQLGEIMQDKSLIGRLLDHWLALANVYGKTVGPYRRTIIFAVNIAHSIAIRDRFAAAGIRIGHLDGTTPDKERKHLLRAIAAGDIDAITNVGVLLEGVDVVSLKCVVHARPTQSLVLWRQSCGRILRPWHPGCPPGCRLHPSVEPLLLDHAGNVSRHGFPHEDLHWELTSKPRSIERRLATRICVGCYAYIPAWKPICPYCGAEAPPPPPDDLPRETEERLRQMASTPEEMRKLYMRSIVAVAKAKGYKPGFAAARYKQRYGHWPPYEWSAYAKQIFASDPVWQANYTAHQEKKARIEAQKQAKEAAKAEKMAPEEEQEDDDIAF